MNIMCDENPKKMHTIYKPYARVGESIYCPVCRTNITIKKKMVIGR